MSKNEPHRKYLRIQEYKNGERVFVKEEKRQFYIDSFLAGCDDKRLEELMAGSDFPFMHDKSFWDMIRKFSLMADDKFKRCEWIHNAYNIQKRLETEGKKVMWFEWGMTSTMKKAVTMESRDGKQVFSQCCTGADNTYYFHQEILPDPRRGNIKKNDCSGPRGKRKLRFPPTNSTRGKITKNNWFGTGGQA